MFEEPDAFNRYMIEVVLPVVIASEMRSAVWLSTNLPARAAEFGTVPASVRRSVTMPIASRPAASRNGAPGKFQAVRPANTLKTVVIKTGPTIAVRLRTLAIAHRNSPWDCGSGHTALHHRQENAEQRDRQADLKRRSGELQNAVIDPDRQLRLTGRLHEQITAISPGICGLPEIWIRLPSVFARPRLNGRRRSRGSVSCSGNPLRRHRAPWRLQQRTARGRRAVRRSRRSRRRRSTSASAGGRLTG